MDSGAQHAGIAKGASGVEVAIGEDRWSSAIDVEALSRSVVSAVLELAADQDTQDAEISILFCDDRAIQELNLKWREINKPTNVLSFPAADFAGRQGPVVLGDIVIAFETCQREAIDAGISLEHHTAHMIAHGCLHLLGYDHEDQGDAKEMEGLEVTILASVGVADPYRDMAPAGEG